MYINGAASYNITRSWTRIEITAQDYAFVLVYNSLRTRSNLKRTLRKQQSVMEVTDDAEYVPNVTFIRSTIRSHHTILPNVRHQLSQCLFGRINESLKQQMA